LLTFTGAPVRPCPLAAGCRSSFEKSAGRTGIGPRTYAVSHIHALHGAARRSCVNHASGASCEQLPRERFGEELRLDPETGRTVVEYRHDGNVVGVEDPEAGVSRMY